MSVKEIALETINQLPEDTDWESVHERLNFVAGVQDGLDELEKQAGIPVGDIEKELLSLFHHIS